MVYYTTKNKENTYALVECTGETIKRNVGNLIVIRLSPRKKRWQINPIHRSCSFVDQRNVETDSKIFSCFFFLFDLDYHEDNEKNAIYNFSLHYSYFYQADKSSKKWEGEGWNNQQWCVNVIMHKPLNFKSIWFLIFLQHLVFTLLVFFCLVFMF